MSGQGLPCDITEERFGAYLRGERTIGERIGCGFHFAGIEEYQDGREGKKKGVVGLRRMGSELWRLFLTKGFGLCHSEGPIPETDSRYQEYSDFLDEIEERSQ